MARGTMRGIFTAWLALIALQAVSTKGGSGRITELFNDVDALLQRAIDPKVPAIHDRRTGPPPALSTGPYLDSAERVARANGRLN